MNFKKSLCALSIILSETTVITSNLINFNDTTNTLFAKDLEKTSLTTKADQPSYILGPGDVIKIDFLGIPELSKKYPIGLDGYINLIDLGPVKASDFTILELESYLEKKAQKFVKNPSITVLIVNYRPIKVFVGGEVKKPGLYDFLYEANNENFDSVGIPTLYDALRSAGGITQYSDFTNIKVIRRASKYSGDKSYVTNIDLFKLFLEGDQSLNIPLFDADTILVAKSPTILKEQISKIANSNLEPDIVRVFVSGNVRKPGQVKLSNNSSLTQAIALAGGVKNLSGKISFLRFDKNGKLEKRTFSHRLSQETDINSYKNPRLISGDIIHVDKSLIGKSAEFIGTISPPVVNAYGIYKIVTD